MQTVRALGASLDGTGALAVTVEARIQPKADAATEIVLTGLPDPVLRESRGKLLCALAATRVQLPGGRVHLNLVPAARRKSGEALDLALAAAATVAAGNLPPGVLRDVLLLGEVGIDGRLHPVAGGLAAAVTARDRGVTRLLAPTRTAQEASALSGLCPSNGRLSGGRLLIRTDSMMLILFGDGGFIIHELLKKLSLFFQNPEQLAILSTSQRKKL